MLNNTNRNNLLIITRNLNNNKRFHPGTLLYCFNCVSPNKTLVYVNNNNSFRGMYCNWIYCCFNNLVIFNVRYGYY